MQIPPGSHSTSLCLCVRAHMYERISVMKCLSPGLCMCFVCVLLSCVTLAWMFACPEQWASEPLVSKKPLYSSGMVLGGKRRREPNGRQSPGQERYQLSSVKTTSTAALPWAAINQSARSSHSTHIYFSLKAVRYANASEVCCCWVILPCCRAFFPRPHLQPEWQLWLLKAVPRVNEELKSYLCSTVQATTWFNNAVFMKARFIFQRRHIWSGNNSALGLRGA